MRAQPVHAQSRCRLRPRKNSAPIASPTSPTLQILRHLSAGTLRQPPHCEPLARTRETLLPHSRAHFEPLAHSPESSFHTPGRTPSPSRTPQSAPSTLPGALRAPCAHPGDPFHTLQTSPPTSTPPARVGPMETPLRLALCLLTYRIIQAGPVGVQECDLKPVTRAAHTEVMYTYTNANKGCSSKGGTQEVHVLNVVQTQELTSPVTVELKKGPILSTSPIIVINVKGFMTFKAFPGGMEPMVYLTAGSYAMAADYQLLGNNSMELPTDSQELLQWTQAIFGSVTSFIELQNPKDIRLTMGSDDGSPDICSLQDAFSAKGFLEWDSEPKAMTSCQISGQGGPLEAHILQVIDDPDGSSSGQTDIEVKAPDSNCVLRKDPALLILQTQSKRQWTIDTQHPLTVMASGESSVLLRTSISQDGEQPLSTPDQLIHLAREKGFKNIWYSQMSSVRRVTIKLQNCENNGPTTEESVEPTTPASAQINEQIANLFNLLTPWMCTKDYLSIKVAKAHIQATGFELAHITLLDPSCEAEQNGTHFFLTTKTDACQTSISNGNQVTNQLLLTMKTLPEPTQVPIICTIPTVELKVYQNADFSTPSDTMEAEIKTYAEVSVSGLPMDAHVRIQECSLTPGTEDSRILIVRDVQKMPNVEVLEPPEVESYSKVHRFSFLYRAGLGPSACTGLLACELCLEPEDPINCPNTRLIKTSLNLSISNHNSSGQDQGLGTISVLGITFGAFLIGALLTAALWFIYSHTRPSVRKQPAPTKPAASESSSANHSIGSTQSTPCSTSSMA